MKNNYLIIASAFMLVFTACKKPEIDSPAVERPITIQAQVPQKVYSNIKNIDLDARATVSSNGQRTLFFDWSCTSFPSGHPPIILAPTSANTKVDSIFAGQYLFRLKVRDNMGNQVTAEYPMEVLQDTLNGTPKIFPLSDQEIQLPLNMVYLEGSDNFSVNPLGRKLYFKWLVIDKPAGSAEVVFTSATSAETNAFISKPGKYRFMLELSNELGLTSTDTVDINALPDPLSGTEKLYENLTWTVVDDGWGPYAQLFIKEQDLFTYRNNLNTLVNVWDEEKKDWIPSDRYEWYGVDEGLSIMFFENPGTYEGKKTRVRVKIL